MWSPELELDDRYGSISTEVDGDETVLRWTPVGASSEVLEMMRFAPQSRVLRIFPRTIERDALRHQFDRIREIRLEDYEWSPAEHSEMSERFGLLRAVGLPQGFNVFYAYGLGIHRHYRAFAQTIEKHATGSVLSFTSNGAEGQSGDGEVFRVSLRRFEDYRAAVDRNKGRSRTAASRVNEAERHNAVADLLGLPSVEVKYGRNEMVQKLTEEIHTGHVLTAADREALVDQVSAVAPSVAREAPERFGQLRTDIELVSLESLIDQFERALAGPHSSDEPHWQRFFDSNHFALQQLFAMPIVMLRAQAHLRGGDLTGGGARIADFLCANAVTRTAVVVEIKTPGAAIMEPTSYRGNETSGVYALHRDLSGAIAQVQSQMAAIPQELSLRLARTPEVDLDPWNDVRGAVIVGRVSSLSPQQRDSFVRYRTALSTVTILGYDEVLERLRALLVMLRPAAEGITEAASGSR